MIDYIKISVSLEHIDLKKLSEIEFITKYNEFTGEILKYSIGKFKNLVIIRLAGRVIIKGSLHILFNDATHNYNQFTYNNLVDTLISLCTKFGINPFEAKIDRLEFGVNVLVPFSPKYFIKSKVINYKGRPFSRYISNMIDRFLVYYDLSDYYIKLYDKGLQYRKQMNILRFEVGARKMRFLEDTGIEYLSDLFYIDNLQSLSKLLLKHFDQFLVVDVIHKRNLTDKEYELYINGTNPRYWEGLKPDPKTYPLRSKDPEYKKQKKRYHYDYTKFKKLISKHNATKSKQVLSELIKASTNKLLITDTNIRDKITLFFAQYDPNLERIKNDLFTHYVATNMDKISGQIHPLYNAGKCPKPKVEIRQKEIPHQGKDNKLEVVRIVVDEYYSTYYTDHRIMSEATIKHLIGRCKDIHGLVLTETELLSYAKEIEPKDLVPPF